MDYDDGVTVSGRFTRSARSTGNGRGMGGTATMFGRSQSLSLSQQIRSLEAEAYFAVLRAFGAQSDVISWDKERLMSQLRRELNVDDSLHSDMLERVHGDSKIQQIRSLKGQGMDNYREASPPLDLTYGNVSRKKQKISTVGSHPSSKSDALHHPAGRRSIPKGKYKKGKLNIEIDPWIGRRVKTRWTESDGRSTFYEAVITDYAPDKGYALVYDMNTPDETFEWVDLKKLPRQDLIWVDAPPVSLDKIIPSLTPSKPHTGLRGKKGSAAGVGGGAGAGAAAAASVTASANLRIAHTAPPSKSSKVFHPSSAPPFRTHYTRSGSVSDQNSHEVENGRHEKGEGEGGEHAGQEFEFVNVQRIFAIDKIEEEGDVLKLQKALNYAEEKKVELQHKISEIGDSSDEDNEHDIEEDPNAHPQAQSSKVSEREEEDERSMHYKEESPVRSMNYNANNGEEGGEKSPRNEHENSSNNSSRRDDSIAQEDEDGEG